MASGTQSSLYLRRRSIKELDNDLISSGILTLTGGYDHYNHLLVVFPAGVQDLLCTCYSSAHLVIIIRYYYTICYHGNQNRGLAFLVNLQDWKKDCIQLLVDSLDTVQADHHGTVGVLYAIQPKNKDLQKVFKKLTGLRPSKRSPKPKQYETVIVSNQTELLRYMDIRQLTKDFGGSLQYCHKAWITFMRSTDELEDNINKTLDKLPEAHDKLSMMSEYDVPSDQAEVELLVLQIRNKFQDVMRDLNLEHMIDECKDMGKKLSYPSQFLEYKNILHTPSYTDAKGSIEQYEKQLIKSREDLKAMWHAAEVRVLVVSRMYKYTGKAQKVLSWVKEIGLPSVKEDPLIADSLMKAQLLKSQFEEGFFSIAKNVLWLAEKILKKLDEIINQSTDSLPNLVTFSHQFRTSVDNFRKLAQNKMIVYVNIHQFFMSSQELTEWYRRTLSFLPVQLLCQQSTDRGGVHDIRFLDTEAWRIAINNYLFHHPAPHPQGLFKLRSILPVIENTGIRSQARLLVHRIGVLSSLLKDPSKVSLLNMQGVFRWRKQVLIGYDDITLNFNANVADATEHGVLGHSFDGYIKTRASSRGRLARKLKSGFSLKEVDRDYFLLDRCEDQPLNKSISRHKSLPHILATGTTHSIKNTAKSHSGYTTTAQLGNTTNTATAQIDETANLQRNEDHVLEPHSIVGQSPGSERYVSLAYSEMAQTGVPSCSSKHISSCDFRENKARRTYSAHIISSENRDPAMVLISQSDPVHSSIKERPRPKSLPDIHNNSEPYLSSSLDMDTVVNSSLSAEEKLDLMSKICEGEGMEVSPDLHYKLCTTQVDLGKQGQVKGVTSERANQVPGVSLWNGMGQVRSVSRNNQHSTQPSVLNPIVSQYNLNGTPRTQESHGMASEVVDRQEQVSRSLGQLHSDHIRQRSGDAHWQRDFGYTERTMSENRKPRSYHIGHLDYLHNAQTNGRIHLSSATRLTVSDKQQAQNYIQRNTPGLGGLNGVELDNSSTSLDLSRLYMEDSWDTNGSEYSKKKPSRKPSKRSSIKVEEWMQRQGDQFDVGYSADTSSGANECKRSKDHRENLDNDREEKKGLGCTSMSVMSAEAVTCDGLESVGAVTDRLEVLQQAEKDQDAVHLSLQNTEKILQEQEEILCQMFDLGTSASSSNSSVTLLEISASRRETHQPIVKSKHPSRQWTQHRSSQEERQWEGSLSEESGVYTHASSDSRLRMLDLGLDTLHIGRNSTSLHCLSTGKSLPRVLQEDCGDSSHLNESNGPAGTPICKEASLGDSSSQTTVITEIRRDQSLSSDGSSCHTHSTNLERASPGTSARSSPGSSPINKHVTNHNENLNSTKHVPSTEELHSTKHLHSKHLHFLNIDEHGIISS